MSNMYEDFFNIKRGGTRTKTPCLSVHEVPDDNMWEVTAKREVMRGKDWDTAAKIANRRLVYKKMSENESADRKV